VYYCGIDYSISSPAICIGEEGYSPNECEYYCFSDKKRIYLPKNYTIIPYPIWSTPEQRFNIISENCMTFIKKHKVKRVFLEGYAYSGSGKVFEIAENCGLLKHKLWSAGYKMDIFAPSSIKKSATGAGNSNKEAVYQAWLTAGGIDLQGMLAPKAKNIGNPVSDIVDSYFIMKHGIVNCLP